MQGRTQKTDKGLPQYVDADESDVLLLSGLEYLVLEFDQDAGGQCVVHDKYSEALTINALEQPR